jgi:Tol biopolymer transport system component
MGKRSIAVFICLSLVVLILFSTSRPVNATSGDITRISVSSNGTEADMSAYRPSVSADGRYVAFESSATNLVTGDTNGVSDIFVRDRQTNTTIRVSVDSAGDQGNGVSYYASISGDGRYVAFESDATNLVAGDENDQRDIFLHDLNTGMTTLISVSSGGVQTDNISRQPDISFDGNFVVFHSEATNLVAGDTNNHPDVFIRDLVNGTTARVSLADDEEEADSSSVYAAVSANGTYVSFTSDATNLVTGDTNGLTDVFVRDLVNETTTRVSVASNGDEGNGNSGYFYGSSISADGRYVAFVSGASNLVDGDANGADDVFVHDLTTGNTIRASVNSNGDEADQWSRDFDISSDGRYVLFESYATNLVASDNNGEYDIFLRDLVEGTTIRVSLTSNMEESNGGSCRPDFSADGTALAFDASASNLVVNDNNGVTDVFIITLASPEIEILNYIPLICN